MTLDPQETRASTTDALDLVEFVDDSEDLSIETSVVESVSTIDHGADDNESVVVKPALATWVTS